MDHGPGIANVGESLRDGHSTAGSPGTGLGALQRLTTEFEIYSQAGNGVVARFEVWPSAVPPRRSGRIAARSAECAEVGRDGIRR